MKILIDNGHGRETPGKRSPNGVLREYAYARKVADLIVALLRSDGYDADLLVPEENDVSLAERCDRVNKQCVKYGSANVLFVSIHLNAGGHGDWGKWSGWSAYTTKGKTQSDILADYIYREAMKEFPGKTFRGLKEEQFYVLRNTKCAAVLTENFFMDSREDYDFLMEEKTPARLACVHVRALKEYVKAYGR